MSGAIIAKRVLYRTAVSIWKHKTMAGLMVGAVALLAGGGSVLQTTPLSPGVEVAGVQAVGTDGDCADAAMAAIVRNNSDVAHVAYRCMSPTLVQGMSEDQFVRQVANRGGTPADAKVQRLGDYQAPSGEHIVYFALTSRSQTVGYIVYLDRFGKVAKME